MHEGAQKTYEMRKDHFKLSFDSDRDLRYIKLAVDESTKTHKEVDQDIKSPFMPEMKDDKNCPVTSYLTYIMPLNKSSDLMWQTTRMNTFPDDPKSHIWYGPGRIGENTLGAFITNITQKIGLGDEKYTNHCLRVTGINTLKCQKQFSNKEIHVFSGHKCDNSLSIYEKVNNDTKIKMGKTLGHALLHIQQPKPIMAAQEENKSDKPQILQIAYEPENPLPNAENMIVAIPNPDEQKSTPVEQAQSLDLTDQDIMKIISDCETETQVMSQM